jgi:hypothetical protein
MLPELFGSSYITLGIIVVVLLLLLLLLIMVRSRRKAANAGTRAAADAGGRGVTQAPGAPDRGKMSKADKKAAAEFAKAQQRAAEEAAKAQKQAAEEAAKAQKQAAKAAKAARKGRKGAEEVAGMEAGLDYLHPQYGTFEEGAALGFENPEAMAGPAVETTSAVPPGPAAWADLVGAGAAGAGAVAAEAAVAAGGAGASHPDTSGYGPGLYQPGGEPFQPEDTYQPEMEAYLPDTGTTSDQPGETRAKGKQKRAGKSGKEPIAPAAGVLPAFDPIQAVLTDILQGWGDLSTEDTNRLDVFRPDRVLAAIAAAEIPKELKNSEYARTRLTQLRRYAAYLQREDAPKSDTLEPEFAGIGGGWRPEPEGRPAPAEIADLTDLDVDDILPVEEAVEIDTTGETAPEAAPVAVTAGTGAAGLAAGAGALAWDVSESVAPREDTETPVAEAPMDQVAPMETELPVEEEVLFEAELPVEVESVAEMEMPPVSEQPTGSTWGGQMAEASKTAEEAVAAAAAAFWAKPEGQELARQAQSAAADHDEIPTQEEEAPFLEETPIAPSVTDALGGQPTAQEPTVGPAEAVSATSVSPLDYWGDSEEPVLEHGPTPALQWEPVPAGPVAAVPKPLADTGYPTIGVGMSHDEFLASLRGKISTAAGVMALAPEDRAEMLPFLEPPELFKVFQTADGTRLKLDVIDTLESIGSPNALDIIHRCLDDPDPEVQMHALDAADRMLGT